MKKILTLPLAMMMIFSLAACGGGNDGTTPAAGDDKALDSSQQKDTGSARITPVDQIHVETLTLLERVEYAFVPDGERASVELYTSASIADDGQMGWDSGDQWTLLIRQGEQVFLLYDEYVQYGEVQFWISSLNTNGIDSPEIQELDHHIYVMVTTGVGFTMYDYVWNGDDGCFRKSVLLSPDDPWNTLHSNKYTLSGQGAARLPAAKTNAGGVIVLGGRQPTFVLFLASPDFFSLAGRAEFFGSRSCVWQGRRGSRADARQRG